ncbi:signal transduction histidine kinase [Lachnospiraceae bacterium JC7]|nr:signal transduction histidine kinase [Lachnospiraceae bacterium JC7]
MAKDNMKKSTIQARYDEILKAWIRKKTKMSLKYMILAIVGILSTFILLMTGLKVFHDYKNELMKNQQDQLLLMARTISRNVSADMENYIKELELFSSIIEEKDNDEILRQYLENGIDLALNVYIEDENGKIVKALKPSADDPENDSDELFKINDLQMISDAGNGITLWQGHVDLTPEKAENEEVSLDWNNRDVLIFKKRIENPIKEVSSRKKHPSGIVSDDSSQTDSYVSYVCYMIDEDRYYDNLLSDVHIGTNGYIVIKNSENLMLMHPSKEQWGISVISGRMEMFPDLDYQSLERLLDKQNRGEEGVADYYSYWWMEDEVPRVRKISGYSPVRIGDDFWIVSAVVDYDDYYQPILEGFQGIVMVATGILLVFVCASVGILRLISANNRASHEIDYLKNLNQVLEEMHRSENAIAHQQRLQIMGTMTGGIAHEFNNFLTPIMGHAELLMLSLPEDSDEYDSAREILQASEKAKDVVHQMSAMSRKNVETIFRNLEASKLVNRFFRMAESICPESVEIEKKNDVKNEYILGNSTQINQVLLNITVNGIQAMSNKEEGKLKLKAYVKEQSDISIKEFSKDKVFRRYLVFEIGDNGVGMSENVRKQIFEPFYTTKKPGEGTGLGLSLAEQIVEEHKGMIHIDSEIGKGTTFYVYFPVIEVQGNEQKGGSLIKKSRDAMTDFFEAEKMQVDVILGHDRSGEGDIGLAKQPQKMKVRKINVMVVDDNHKILSLLKDGLDARESINAVMCDSIEELHKELQRMVPDIVLIDENVGNYSGIEIFMSEFSDSKDSLRIIMADSINRDIVEAKKRGLINGYMEKPVSEAEIIGLAEQISRNIKNLNKL